MHVRTTVDVVRPSDTAGLQPKPFRFDRASNRLNPTREIRFDVACLATRCRSTQCRRDERVASESEQVSKDQEAVC